MANFAQIVGRDGMGIDTLSEAMKARAHDAAASMKHAVSGGHEAPEPAKPDPTPNGSRPNRMTPSRGMSPGQ